MVNDDDYARLFRDPDRPSSAWEDVLREFSALGDNLALAVRAAWERRENRARVREVQDSLQSMIDGVNHAIGDSTNTPEAQQAREQLARVTESVREAAERTADEVRPQLLNVLRQANAELRRLARNDDQNPPPPPQLP
jgi:ElaB/YqjD/DUF883 family membrane-anchored ribosome-binding protein